MSQEHELDERLRQRVASLFDRDSSPAVDVAGRARALAEAWREQRRARRRRAQRVALSCGVFAAAACALIAARGAWWPQPTAAGKNAQPTAAGGCRLPAAPTWSVGPAGQRVLALGELGRLVGDGRVVASSACELRVEVADGTLAGQLHALRPSRIVIATAGGSVIVTGTRLSVRARGDELRVVLAAGKVSVDDAGGMQELTAGHVLTRRAGGAASTLPLSAAEASRLDQWLGVGEDDEQAVLAAPRDVSADGRELEASSRDDGDELADQAVGTRGDASVRERGAARVANGERHGGGEERDAVADERAGRSVVSRAPARDGRASSEGRDARRAGESARSTGVRRVGPSAANGGDDAPRAAKPADRDARQAEQSSAAHGGEDGSPTLAKAANRDGTQGKQVAAPGARTSRGVGRQAAPAEDSAAQPARVGAGQLSANARTADVSTCDERDGSASSGELLSEGERARKQGRLSVARRCYAAAADGGNADAEVALLRWVRLELDHEALDRASALLARHAREYARPTLAAEAAWLDVQVLAARGESASARAAAEALIRAHATTPQARAARAWLRQQ